VVTSGIGLALQAMSVKIGIVTGKHLAQLCRQEYSTSKWVSQWIMAEVSIIASDVQAVVTSAIALKILFKLPLWIGCILTAFDALTFLSLHLLGVRSLEGFFVAIVCVMSVCFFWTFSLRPPDPLEVLTGLIPSIPSYGLSTAVGVIGSLILPQNYFVHRSLIPPLPPLRSSVRSAVVLSRPVDRSSAKDVREATKYMIADAAVALFVALCLNFAVISNFAELFFHIGPDPALPPHCAHPLASPALPDRLCDGLNDLRLHR
jgi:natural resistance-associated macrophage protein 2